MLTGDFGADVVLIASAQRVGAGRSRDRITDVAAGSDTLDFHDLIVGGDHIGADVLRAGHGSGARRHETAFTGGLTV